MNSYYPPLCSPDSSEQDNQLANKMLEMSKQVNLLREEVDERKLDSKTNWRPISEDDAENFPRLSEEDLRTITCGVYQLKLSPCYMKEHLDESCSITIHRNEHNLIRVRLQSRHVSAKQHTLWIRFNDTNIVAWYCRCRAGARVVGMCAHVAAILWYLGYAKQRFISSADFGVQNWGAYLTDASNLPEQMDISDSDSDSESM